MNTDGHLHTGDYRSAELLPHRDLIFWTPPRYRKASYGSCATVPGHTDIPGITLDHMTSDVPPLGVSISDARLEEVADGIDAYIQPDGSRCRI